MTHEFDVSKTRVEQESNNPVPLVRPSGFTVIVEQGRYEPVSVTGMTDCLTYTFNEDGEVKDIIIHVAGR